MQTSSLSPSQVRLIETAMLSGPVVFAVIVGFLTAGDPNPVAPDFPEFLPLGFAVFAVAALPIAFVLHRSLLSGGRDRMRLGVQRIAARFVSMAVLEAAMLSNLVMWLLTREQWPSAVAAVLPFVAGVAQACLPIRADDADAES